MNVYGFLGLHRRIILIDKDINGNTGQFYQFYIIFNDEIIKINKKNSTIRFRFRFFFLWNIIYSHWITNFQYQWFWKRIFSFFSLFRSNIFDLCNSSLTSNKICYINNLNTCTYTPKQSKWLTMLFMLKLPGNAVSECIVFYYREMDIE